MDGYTKGSELVSALEHFWNGWVTARPEKDVILVVCASATYWLMDNIVNSKGGLHNRLTGQIRLKPFNLAECEEYLKTKNISFNRHQIIQCYMILGGVPAGIAFERVCLEHITQIKNALGISGVQTSVNSWKCESDSDRGLSGSQIDLLIVRKDQIINVCEMKYSESDYVPDLAFDKAMRRKISDLQKATKTKFAIHSTLVTTYDVEENSYYGNIQSIVTGEDLFR